MSVLADQLRRQFSGTPAGCSCALDVAEQLRRVIGGDGGLCRIHDVAAIERRAADDALAIARERHDILRDVVADRDAAALPACSCPSVRQLVHAGFGGETLPACLLHAAPSQIPSEQNISVGDDHALLGVLSDKLGITTVITEL